MNHRYTIKARLAPWWLACFRAACALGDVKWAHWLARHPSVVLE